MKHIFNIKFFALAVACIAINACKSDDTDLSGYIYDLEHPQYMDISIDRSPLADSGEETDVTADDMVENVASSITVGLNFTDNDVEITGGGSSSTVRITKEGAHAKVVCARKGLKLILSGKTSDGGLQIFSDNKFVIEMNGASITNPSGPAINNQGKKTCYVVLCDNTKNTLADGSGYAVEANGIQAKGAFFSEGQLVFSGSGSLDIYGNNKHGIASDDYVRIRKGTDIYIKVAKHQGTSGSGIKANDGVYLNGGVVNIEADADGGKGINCEDSVIVSGGRLTVINTGAPVIDTSVSDTTSCACVKTDMAFILKGGDIALLSKGEGGKGVNSTGNITVTGGTLNVVALGDKGIATPKGIKTKGDMTMTGGYISSFCLRATPLEVTGKLDYGSKTLSYSNNRKTITIF